MMTTKDNACAVVAMAVAALFAQSGANAQQTEAPEQAVAQPQYLSSLRRARDQLMSAGDFEAALEPAQIVVREPQTSETATASDRIMLAVILAELERHDEAELELLDVVESFQDEDGLFSDSLITPLRLLGRTYIRARRFPQAITALTEARSISRRNAGLFNVEHQIGVIDDLTNAQLGLGDTTAARDLQLERLETAQRQFGIEDPRVIPYHYHLADYYENSRLRQSAREQYEAALAIAQSQSDTEQMLIALSNIVRQDLQTDAGDTNLLRLQEFVNSPRASGHQHQLGIAHAVLGDAALVDEDESAATQHYALAWELLESAGEVDPAAFFGDPAVIRLIAPLTPVDVNSRSLPYAWGTIRLEFDVGRNGRVTDLTGIGSEPADIMDDAYVERLMDAWFRPAIVAGEPTEAAGVVFTHYFRFYVDPDDAED